MQNELDRKIREYGSESIANHFKAFFEKYPEIDGIVWEQYTPYFNDGDSCTFGVGEQYMVSESIVNAIKNSSKESGTKDLVYVDDWQHEYAFSVNTYGIDNNPLEGMKKDFRDLTSQMPDSILLAVFGDHARVMINKDGTSDVEEMDDHD